MMDSVDNQATIRRPPQALLDFDLSPEDILIKAEGSIIKMRQLCHTQAEYQHDSVHDVLRLITEAENEFIACKNLLGFFKSTSTSLELREASAKATILFNQFESENAVDQRFSQLIERMRRQRTDLDTESQMYIERKYQILSRRGYSVEPGPSQQRFKDLQARIQEITLDCQKSLNKTSGIWLSEEELKGYPGNYIDRLQTVQGDEKQIKKYFFPLKRPDLGRALQFVANERVRRKIYIAHDNRCLDNVPRQKELVWLRNEMARLLGYANYLQMTRADRMDIPQTYIANLLSELQVQLEDKAKAELEELRQLKHQHLSIDCMVDRSSTEKAPFFVWDHLFFSEQAKVKGRSLEGRVLSEYFELEHTLDMIRQIYSRLFDLHFAEIGGQFFSAEHKWHSGVSIFAVWEDGPDTNDFLGYLYLDLFPREDKYNHAGHYNLSPGYLRADGSRHYPLSALVMNLPKSTAAEPSLLRHEEIRSLFHEFGHAIHNLLSRTKYAIFHGTSVARDFVEIPAIMFENWWWQPDLIKDMSYHYSYLSDDYASHWRKNNPASKSLPPRSLGDEIVASCVASRHEGAAIATLKQCATAQYDLQVHVLNSESECELLNPSALWNRLYSSITLLEGAEYATGSVPDWEWGHAPSRYGLFVRGYAAGYYAYPLGKVIAQDLFVTRFQRDPMDKEVAREFRKKVLEPGGTRDGMELIISFLGRQPRADARFGELRLANTVK